MAIPSNPHEASPKIGVLLSGGRKSLGGQGLSERPTLRAVGLKLGLDVRMIDGSLRVRNCQSRPAVPRPLWSRRLSSKSSFCRAAVQSGLLTHRQMVHAAWRYRLGRSKDDAVIYWQIDQLGHVHDGKLMWYGPDCHRLKHRGASWVMYLLKQHYGVPQDTFQSTHVFFGTHLLSTLHATLSTVCVVEAEKSAVILSELYPHYIWLAAGGMSEVQVSKFLPLRYYRVILFPDTDPDGRAYRTWYEAAQQVMQSSFWPKSNPIRVSPLLELNATPEQKQRKIDLVDYHFENTSAVLSSSKY